ncbi:MAG TPA: hypothetical protein VN193_04365 [Candidatus Angelobacter sp.]|jgi:hypothetical protein|nr:hypothetical protein [Candidatus Angelobacter sp.]
MSVDAFVPTHRVSANVVACWAAPDPSTPALATRLDPGLEVRSLERRGEWMHVECSNGWTAWVDARLMEQLDTGFHATHVVPATRLAAYASHDTATPPVATLDARLPVQLLESWGDWANVRCSNGWSAWVDGRMLEPATSQRAPMASAPATAWPPATRRRNPLAGALLLLFTSPQRVTRTPLAATGPMALLGAALVGAGTALPLLSVPGFASVSAWDTPAGFLVSDTPDPSSFKLGVVLLIAAALVLAPLLTQRPLWPIALIVLAAPATNVGVHVVIRKLQSGGLYPDPGPGAVMLLAGGFLIVANALWWMWRERLRAFQ